MDYQNLSEYGGKSKFNIFTGNIRSKLATSKRKIISEIRFLIFLIHCCSSNVYKRNKVIWMHVAVIESLFMSPNNFIWMCCLCEPVLSTSDKTIWQSSRICSSVCSASLYIHSGDWIKFTLCKWLYYMICPVLIWKRFDQSLTNEIVCIHAKDIIKLLKKTC